MMKSKSTTTKSSKSRTVDRNDQEKPPGEDFDSEQRQASRMMNMEESEGLAGSSEAVGSHPQVAPFASLGSSSQPPTHAFDNLDAVDLPQYVKAHITTLTFPEKMMLMLIHVDRMLAKEGKRVDTAAISWTPSGQAFVIRDKDKVVSELLPLFAGRGKFSSFTRKLYRWGFRQVYTPPREEAAAAAAAAGGGGGQQSECRELVFANENFQRDNKSLLPRMKSTTAASIRRQQAAAEKEQEQAFPDTTSQESKDGQSLSDFQRKLTEGQQQGRTFSSLAMLSAPSPGIASSSSLIQQAPGPGLVGLDDAFNPTLVDLVNALHTRPLAANPSNEIVQQALNELIRQRQLAAIANNPLLQPILQSLSARRAPPPQVPNDELLTSLLAAAAASSGRAAAISHQQPTFNQAQHSLANHQAIVAHNANPRSSEIDERLRLAVDLYLRNAAATQQWPPPQGSNNQPQGPPPAPPRGPY